MIHRRTSTKTHWYVCAGMRRSAGTWQYQIAEHILKPSGTIPIGWIIHQDFDEIANALDKTLIGSVVCKVHPFLPDHCETPMELLNEGRLTVLYSYRDIRDVYASMKVRQTKPIPYSELSGILAVDRKWRSLICTYSMRYETMIENPANEILRMAQWLGVESYVASRATAIAEHFSFDANRRRLPKGGQNIKTLLWHDHIRDGTVGKWKYELTDAEKRMFREDEMIRWLRNSGYEIT